MGASADHTEPQSLGEGLTILIVEDDPLTRLTTASSLRESGYKVVEAGNADETISIMSSSHAIHLVFSDVFTPGSKGGLSLVGWILTHHPSVPVILTSGNTRVLQYFDTAATIPFLPKPYRLETLRGLVSRLLSAASQNEEG
jgi:DNA-binding NtrC family response regulator